LIGLIITSISNLFATGDYTVPAEKSNPAIDNAAIPQHIVLGWFFVVLVVCISGVMVILRFGNFSGTFSAVILGCFTRLARNSSIFVLYLQANWLAIPDFQ
ncbi:MAG: hypothetical protein U9N86_12805, partial [Bacteroidota bacterium]|nr:hypothetical protein [Bacteroidota bacterium]